MNLFQAAIGTRTGNRHRATDTPNQDYACYALLPNNMGIVAAVSDGAGSAPKAATGSKSSAQAATRKAWKTALRLGQAPDPAICVSEGVKAARKAVEVTALVQGNSLEHYHATLLVAVMTEDKTAVAHIGDGASIVLTGDNYKMLTIPARGEYANETFFITMDDYLDLVASNETESATELLLFTDGVQNELIDFKKRKAHQKAANSLKGITLPALGTEDTADRPKANSPRILDRPYHRLCQWLEDGATTHGDDATLLILRKTHNQR